MEIKNRLSKGNIAESIFFYKTHKTKDYKNNDIIDKLVIVFN